MLAKRKSDGKIIEVREWRGASDVVYSTLDMNEFYQASDLDFLLKKETAVLEGLVGRDKCGNIFLYPTMPFRGKDEWQEKYQEYIDVQKRFFPLRDVAERAEES